MGLGPAGRACANVKAESPGCARSPHCVRLVNSIVGVLPSSANSKCGLDDAVSTRILGLKKTCGTRFEIRNGGKGAVRLPKILVLTSS